jgi:hypothetical protein
MRPPLGAWGSGWPAALGLPSSMGALPLPRTASANETNGDAWSADVRPSNEDGLKSSQSTSSSPASLVLGAVDGEKGELWVLRVEGEAWALAREDSPTRSEGREPEGSPAAGRLGGLGEGGGEGGGDIFF